ncbi:Rrf2 family transcriptional regulator [Bdellovibrio sp. NC01]|uniref:RrF2 family transcriptional regulator n=1 Tax=Bdellovibrio sp. NC01 TaxID=2220073 RepID=UPI001156EC14|nr:Rrf2 family transcriptional regulator [Bdellovibrio sp. NC01]QDK39315.1 Rrf2 family transcriptional regulator [Bdellovibrio sp. NC01]
MILRNQVEWALHCCTFLATLPEGAYIATKDLAEFHGVPKEYLSKAMQALSQAGLVDTTLGPRGGYRLARPATKINFLEIVEAVEGRSSTFQCTEIRKNNPCKPAKTVFAKPCQIAKVMYKADEAWRKELEAVSLADLVNQLMNDLPKDVIEKNIEWVQSKIT